MIRREKINFARFVNRVILPLVQTTRAFQTSKVRLSKDSQKFGLNMRCYDKNVVAIEIPAGGIYLEQRKIDHIHMHYQNITIIDRVCYIKIDVYDIISCYVDPRKMAIIDCDKIINKIEEKIRYGLNVVKEEITSNAEVLSHDLNLIRGVAKSLYNGFKFANNDDKIQLKGKLKNDTFIICICNNNSIVEATSIHQQEGNIRKVCMTPRGSLYECSVIQNSFSRNLSTS